MSVPTVDEQPVGPVVVGVDGSPSSQQALRWAAGQARLTGQELHAVISFGLPLSRDAAVIGGSDWRGDAAEALRTTVESTLGGPGSGPVVQHVVEGRPAKVLLDAARDAGLLVVGSRGHGGVTGLLLGSVSEHVLAHATCPVVVVRERRTATGRIVVGVDGSHESQRALRWAARQARLSGSAVHAVGAWRVPLGSGLTVRPEADWAGHTSHTLAAAVAGALGEEDATGVVQEVVEGHPADALLSAATDADLLVVGSRGRGAFAGLLLGSVSRHVAAHAPCPAVVHHDRSSTP
ncbi:universal stress protein [Modestobacter sp. I12A-02662]|uniref:universal stress protein n=1 Tax=Modestobacter sp. I12A-02662 TaxID=1730496 RepID=UPI0034DEE653